MALEEQGLVLEAVPLVEAQRVLIRDHDARRHLSAVVGACALNGFLQQAASQAAVAFGGVATDSSIRHESAAWYRLGRNVKLIRPRTAWPRTASRTWAPGEQRYSATYAGVIGERSF
jgi:hypothetical protein